MTNRIVVPERYADRMRDSKSRACFMGLSVGKKEFTDPNVMEDYVEFISENFCYGVLGIADHPKRWNIMALEGLGIHEAQRRVTNAGEDMYRFLYGLTKRVVNVKPLRWKDFKYTECKENFKVIQKAYSNDHDFREEVNSRVLEFLNTPSNLERIKAHTTLEKALETSKNYYLEELAFLLLIPFEFDIPVVEVYPTPNTLQERLQAREFDFCKDLEIKDDRVFVEAKWE